MEVIGYKCFNKDFTNRYGLKFETGKLYIAQPPIKFGLNGSGFHLCKNIEDTFRYYDAMNDEVLVCKVKGSGDITECCDEYYGYYEMYSVENLEILEILNREQIINIGLQLNELRVKRFISGYKLSKKEIEMFKEKFLNFKEVLLTLEYYQNNNKNAYLESVIDNGQYYNKRC